MKQYLEVLQELLAHGTRKENRTGVDTLSVFGRQLRFDLREGFPLLTTKKVFLKGVIHELLWLISGDTNIKYLTDNDVHIWDEWADTDGDLGPVYGKQWRCWWNGRDSIDQLNNAVERLKTNPDCRRIIVSAWNVGELDEMALAPCHAFFQFYTEDIPLERRLEMAKWTTLDRRVSSEKATHLKLDEQGVPRRYLSCQLYQRSADWFLGVPFNIASYSLLTMMVAQVVGMVPKDFVHTFGDAHLYVNHMGQAIEQLARTPRQLPVIVINPRIKHIDDFVYGDFIVGGYDPYPPIKAEVAV